MKDNSQHIMNRGVIFSLCEDLLQKEKVKPIENGQKAWTGTKQDIQKVNECMKGVQSH